MRFFTPDILDRFGSPDETVASAAGAEWERLQEEYAVQLARIRSDLPASVRSLLRTYYLHDANVLTMGHRKDRRFLAIFLQLANPRREGVQITYRLARKPELVFHPAASEGKVPLAWQYDELEVLRTDPYASVFRHSILFTGGRELQITFSSLQWVPYHRLLSPAIVTLEEEGSELENLLT